MTPIPLQRPYIGITISRDEYCKVKGLLPTPSYQDTLYSRSSSYLTLIYVIDGYIISPKQYRWISNIKLGLMGLLFVPFKFEEEFCITDTTEITNNIYTIDELSKAFKAQLITYPRIMYPSTKKEIYKHLCWYGKRLIHQRAFTKEVMIATALLMNKTLDDNYQDKELYKKFLGAYIWLVENKDGFKVRLTKEQLKEVHAKGGKIRKENQARQTKEKVQHLLKSGDFIKPNGKVNLSLLAKTMNMTRQTIAKYIEN